MTEFQRYRANESRRSENLAIKRRARFIVRSRRQMTHRVGELWERLVLRGGISDPRS